MLFRNCAGGIVFNDDKVFILKNDKDEWVLPKGKIREGFLAAETAVERVEGETGLNVQIISTAGETSYEFFSLSRQKPVCNEIIWYIMESSDDVCYVNKEEGFIEGKFCDVEEALEKITHSQDKALVNLSFRKFFELQERKIAK